jgi:hypothetical protein
MRNTYLKKRGAIPKDQENNSEDDEGMMRANRE